MKLRNNFGFGDSAAPASIRFLVLRATTQQARDLGWRHLPLRNGSIEMPSTFWAWVGIDVLW